MNVRLSIRDSLYRLARSAMERQNISDRSSTNKGNKEEDEISADEESNNQNRYNFSDKNVLTWTEIPFLLVSLPHLQFCKILWINSRNFCRYSRLIDSEAVTNPIDRIVAHLLFHNPSGSSLMPIADAGMSMATSMWPWECIKNWMVYLVNYLAASQHKLKESLWRGVRNKLHIQIWTEKSFHCYFLTIWFHFPTFWGLVFLPCQEAMSSLQAPSFNIVLLEISILRLYIACV